MKNLEAEEAALETILLNGKNEKANRYIKSALAELRASLSDLSDADFELATTNKIDFECARPEMQVRNK